jgi:hypothetical protein
MVVQRRILPDFIACRRGNFPALPGEESSDRVLIEKVMAELAAGAIRPDAYQHRHQFIIGAQQVVVSIDIDYLDLQAGRLRHGLQRVQHVVAEMTVGT